MVESSVNSKQLRKYMKTRRAQLSPSEQTRYSQQACNKIRRSSAFRAAKHIALYLPVRGEISPLPLLKSCTNRNIKTNRYFTGKKQFYLPVLAPYAKDGLIFIRWDKKTRFRMNRFQIKEPQVTAKGRFSKRSLDLVIMPLLAFDEQGNRLGMGGGFYDRTFAFRRQAKQERQRRLSQQSTHQKQETSAYNRKPLLMGLAYHFQQSAGLPCQPWDVSLDALATDQAMYRTPL